MSARRIVVAGASGLIGTALRRALAARGDQVVQLVRREPAGADEIRWDPESRHLDPSTLEGAQVVVNLAGAGVGEHRWTPRYKRVILTSRVDTTHALAGAAAAVAERGTPIRMVVGTAVGYYGDRGDTLLTESSEPGTGFLSEVVRAWEGAAAPAVEAGVPVAFGRTGLVLSRDGGAAQPLLRLARFGLAGPLGNGRQWWPWITLHDEVRALLHLIDGELTGPVNLTSAQPARMREVATALAAAMHRPAVLPAPAIALRLVLGEFAADVLASQRVLPAELVADGFQHDHPDLASAARWVVQG